MYDIKEEIFKYGLAGEAATVFAQVGKSVYIKKLFGMEMGLCGKDGGPFHARGLLLLDTSLGRFEADGLEAVEASFGDREIKLIWKAVGVPLKIVSCWRFCTDTGIWSRRDTLHNSSESDIVLYSCVARFPFSPGVYEEYSQSSKWNNENQGCWHTFDHGKMVLSCQGGRSCQGGTPFMGIRQANDTMGAAFHVIPVGNWMIRTRNVVMECEAAFSLVELGLADESLRLVLPKNGSLELPEILFHSLPGGEEHSHTAKLHQYVLKNLFQHNKKLAPLIYNTWFLDFDNLKLDDLRRQLKTAKEIGCEVFVIDAGWFGTGNGWSGEVGYWQEKKHASFYGKMKEFADEVRREGLGFGLWMEPERIGSEAPVLKEHPDWFINSGSGYFYNDLTKPEVYTYVLGEVCRLIETYDLAWMKIDFNFNFGVDRSGGEFLPYYTAWYRLLDELRIRYAHMFFEACASGGLRTDLNIMSRADAHFLSDTVNPLDTIRIYEGALLRLPPGYFSKWIVLRSGGKVVRPYTQPFDTIPDSLVTSGNATWSLTFNTTVNFAAKVCMTGIFGISSDISGLPEKAKEELKENIRYYKEWRKFIISSVAHLLSAPALRLDRSGWSAVQLQDPEATTSLLFVYRLEDYNSSKNFRLKGLRDDKSYRVKSLECPEINGIYSGDELMVEGMNVRINSCNEAAIVEVIPEL